MPLINVLGLCADSPPTCVAISDCSGHMSTGGRKDARYIAEMMEEIIQPYDPEKIRSTLFWFDGANNVQKAGKILETKFPRSYTLHGGKHVVALFFSDIAKIFEIKVMYWFLINYCCIVFLKYLCHWQTVTSPEGLSPVQHIWIRSHSQYLCPVHGTIQYSQQRTQDRSSTRGYHTLCHLVLESV